MEIFWMITQEERIALTQYQWEHYREKLNIPPEPAQPAAKEPPPEEASVEYVREMQQAPQHQRRVD